MANNWKYKRERSRHPRPTRHPSPDEYSPAGQLTDEQLDEMVEEVKANVQRRGPDYLRRTINDLFPGRGPMILDNPSLLIPDNMGTGSSTQKHRRKRRKHPTRKRRKHPTRKRRKHPTRKRRKHPTRKRRKHPTRKRRKRPRKIQIL